jgi:hypothetical protein
MSRVRPDLFDISPTTICARCREVAASPECYDFADRVRICEQYSALIGLFSNLNVESDKDLLVGALAVYGWMPTMMDELRCLDKLKSLILDLGAASNDSIGSILGRYRDTGALRSVNNSVVGTSKLLHFFFPDKDRHLGFGTWAVFWDGTSPSIQSRRTLHYVCWRCSCGYDIDRHSLGDAKSSCGR